MNDFHFRIRPYSKRELARLYFPDTANDESAVANLRNLIRRVNGLGRQDLYAQAGRYLGPLSRGTVRGSPSDLLFTCQAVSYSLGVAASCSLDKPLVVHFTPAKYSFPIAVRTAETKGTEQDRKRRKTDYHHSRPL